MVNVASLAGLVRWPVVPVYSATKAAVVSFGNACAEVFARHNMRLNTVCPGFADTRLVRTSQQQFGMGMGRDIRVNVKVDDVVKTIVALLTISSSHGKTILVNEHGAVDWKNVLQKKQKARL